VDFSNIRPRDVLKVLWRTLIHGSGGEASHTRTARSIRWARIALLIMAVVMTMAAVLLVAGAWRNDLAIERNMGVAAAEVLSAGPRRSTIEFVTPDRITYRPELGVLYPSELDAGMRIYVEYDKANPNLVRVQHRNASLAIIPAGSVAVISWLVAAAALFALAVLERSRTAGRPADGITPGASAD
jgi:hypothetical protein